MGNKILIIRLSSLGDVQLTTPVIRALRKQFPLSKISFAVKKEYQDIVSDNPYLDEVITFDYHRSHKGIRGLFKFINLLKQKSFDMVIDLHKNFRSFLIKTFLFNSKKLSYKKQSLRRRLLVCTHLKFKNIYPHIIDSYLETLKPLGITDNDKSLQIFISDNDRKFVDNFLEKHNINNKLLIGINPGARWATKCWLKERFAETADKLNQKYDAHTIIFGGSSDKDLANEIIGLMETKAVSVAGKTSLKQLGAFIERCNILITNDSGPMHIAEAVNTPVIALFGPTVVEFGFAPLNKQDIIINNDLACRPCSLHGSQKCPEKHFNCMNMITVDEVITAAMKILDMEKY